MNKTPQFMDGWHAHHDEVASGENPYDERTQYYSYNQWLSGWCARFQAIKRGEDLLLDHDKGY